MSADEIDTGRASKPGTERAAAGTIALVFMLFASGTRPPEIARIEVQDYLRADGRVRREFESRAEPTRREGPVRVVREQQAR